MRTYSTKTLSWVRVVKWLAALRSCCTPAGVSWLYALERDGEVSDLLQLEVEHGEFLLLSQVLREVARGVVIEVVGDAREYMD